MTDHDALVQTIHDAPGVRDPRALREGVAGKDGA